MARLIMTRPVVGIIGNAHLINDQYPAHACGEMNSAAVSLVSGALPLVVPADPRFVSVEELMATCDGFLLTGGAPTSIPRSTARPRPRRTAPSTGRGTRSSCRWCAPAWSGGSPSSPSAGASRR
jgi:gamma-glutamyl-gamma-aminobutyrate hydrolase PuuD